MARKLLNKKQLEELSKRDYNQTESANVERPLVAYVKELGGLAIKINPVNIAGFPDRLVIFPGEVIVFIETKSKGDKPRKIQEYWHKLLRSLGCNVEVISSKDSIEKVIDKYVRD